MKATVEVTNRQEGAAVKAGLEDATTRALVIVMGALAQLPSDRARLRVLNFVKDRLEEEQGE